MFRDIKANNSVYILRRGEGIKLTEARVVSVGSPRLDTSKIGNISQMLIDVTIKEGEKETTYSIPDNISVTYRDNLVIMSDVDSLIREVSSIKRQSEAVLNSIEQNRNIIWQADEILSNYSPELKEKKRTDDRFNKMEETMNELKNMIQKLTTK